ALLFGALLFGALLFGALLFRALLSEHCFSEDRPDFFFRYPVVLLFFPMYRFLPFFVMHRHDSLNSHRFLY
ncbi:MAG: hypothetical protein II940_00030, partial [Methanosarcinaceae archaeon]|nr:hypothetical protein [Methanosarcinaceae archaeon]